MSDIKYSTLDEINDSLDIEKKQWFEDKARDTF